MTMKDKVRYQLPAQFVCSECGKIVDIKKVAPIYSVREVCPGCDMKER